MRTENEKTETVSQTLENTLAHSLSAVQGMIDTAPGLDTGSPERLAELVTLDPSAHRSPQMSLSVLFERHGMDWDKPWRVN